MAHAQRAVLRMMGRAVRGAQPAAQRTPCTQRVWARQFVAPSSCARDAMPRVLDEDAKHVRSGPRFGWLKQVFEAKAANVVRAQYFAEKLESQGFLDCAERVRAFGRANMQQAMGCMELAADGGEFTTTHEMQHLDSPLGALIQSEEELRDTIKGMVDNDFYKDFFENDENDEDEVYDWLSQLVTTSERHLVELTDARNDILEVEDRANPETPHQDEEPEN